MYSYCRPASCEAHGDADCATERDYRCSSVLQDDLTSAALCTRGMQFCCDSDDDCVQNGHCVIVDEPRPNSQGAAGAAGASAGGAAFSENLDNIGYCAIGDTQLLTAVASASSSATSGSGGTAPMASDQGSPATMSSSSSASNSSGCSVVTGQPAGHLSLLLVAVAGLVQRSRRRPASAV